MITGIVGRSSGNEGSAYGNHMVWGCSEWVLRWTPNVLKWLADTIHDSHCQWSLLSCHWTIKSDLCEDGAISANYMPFCQTSQWKQINHQEVNIDMCPYNGIHRVFSGIQWRWLQFELYSELWGCMGLLEVGPFGHSVETSRFSMYFGYVEVPLMCHIPIWEMTILVVKQSQIGVTGTWFTECAYSFNFVAAMVDALC